MENNNVVNEPLTKSNFEQKSKTSKALEIIKTKTKESKNSFFSKMKFYNYRINVFLGLLILIIIIIVLTDGDLYGSDLTIKLNSSLSVTLIITILSFVCLKLPGTGLCYETKPKED